MRRGKLKFKTFKTKPVILNVKYLNMLPDGTKVNLETLIKNGLVTKEALQIGVKILGDGALEKKLTVSLPVSKGARRKIEKAGGKVVAVKKVKKVEKTAPSKPVVKKTAKKATIKVGKTAKTRAKKTAKKSKAKK